MISSALRSVAWFFGATIVASVFIIACGAGFDVWADAAGQSMAGGGGMKREDAEEFTQSLGQIVGGSWRQIALADKLDVPSALGLPLKDWVQQRLGGYIKQPIEERREAAKELAAEGKSQREIGAVLGVDHKTVSNDLRGDNSPQKTRAQPVTADNEIPTGEFSPSPEKTPSEKAASTRTAHQEIAKAYFDQPAKDVPSGNAVRLGDFFTLSSELRDNSVDLIFTDPPYDDKSLPLFGKMGQVAARILKPGGSLITYLGHMQLIEAGRLLSEHLRFWHPLCCLHSGPFARMTEFGVVETFKPMLWFVKGTRGDKHTFVESSVSGAREKDHHEWQQAEAEAAYFIEALSPKDGLVVDFFAGGATTIVAAQRLGRNAIGYEIDPKHHARGSARVAALTDQVAA